MKEGGQKDAMMKEWKGEQNENCEIDWRKEQRREHQRRKHQRPKQKRKKHQRRKQQQAGWQQQQGARQHLVLVQPLA